jgi:hypothetical protein
MTNRMYMRGGVYFGTADQMMDRIEELEAKLAKAVERVADEVWSEYQDSISEKWTLRKDHVDNAIRRALAKNGEKK